MPYVPDVPNDGSDDDSQPPSIPLSLGLSYRTPRTPSLRHRSVTPSHHFSGGSRSRSQTLTEQMKSPPCMTEACDGSGFYWDWIVTMSDGTTQVQPVSPVAFNKLALTEIGRARAPAEISNVPENPRILAC